MTNKEFGKALELRTKSFAIKVIRLSCRIPNTLENNIIRNQLVKAGTSIGANYREANSSRSKADFLNRIKICQAEANETIYWIELLLESKKQNHIGIQELYRESKELFAMFTAITQKLSKTKT